jgi:hypothetical protein
LTCKTLLSGVTGPLAPEIEDVSDDVLLQSPNDGGLLTAGVALESADSTIGDSRILVAGDIPNAISLTGLSIDPHESLGINSVG